MGTKSISLDEAVVYLRELLYMDKTELLRETGLLQRNADKIKKTDIIILAFERKFDVNARLSIMRNNPFSEFSFGKKTE